MRSLAGHDAREQLVRKEQGFNICADLGQQSGGFVLRRITEEHRAKAKPAANGFFQNTDAIDGTVTIRSKLPVGEGSTQFLYERVVPAFDGAKAVVQRLLSVSILRLDFGQKGLLSCGKRR